MSTPRVKALKSQTYNNNGEQVIISGLVQDHQDPWLGLPRQVPLLLSRVKLAEAPDKTLVAIKRFKGETANLDTLKHELTIMKKLHHDNLVNLIDVRENATYRKKTGETYTSTYSDTTVSRLSWST